MANKKKRSKKSEKRRVFAVTTGAKSAASTKRSKARAPESVATARVKLNNGASLFESQWSRRKFEVLGRKRNSEGRRVGLSRSAAIEKRKKTLLQEFKNRGKANVYLDRRFGEKDDGLAEEDKATLRFQRERQVQWQKKSKFTLPDEDEEAILTHGGTALSELDDFEDQLSDEDGEDEQIEELVKSYDLNGYSLNGHTNIGDDTSEKRSKSKKEIMGEIIAKSKFFKVQRAKEKEEDAELKNQLDKDFAALAQSQALISLVRSKKLTVRSTMDQETERKADDFDKLVKEMGMDVRAHASDRLKTEEERAEEEKAELEELEEMRKKRMFGEELSEDSGPEEGDGREVSQMSKRCKVEPSGDDLGENFIFIDDHSKRGWVDDVLARREERDKEGHSGSGEEDGLEMTKNGLNSESSAGESSSDEASESGELEDNVWEESDDEILGLQGRACSLVGADDASNAIKDKTLASSAQIEERKEVRLSHRVSELPFVIEAPKNLQEFKCLVDGRPIADLMTIIQRIRACNSIRLAAENRRKMQIFYGVLLQYFASMAGGKILSLDTLNALVKPLIEMSSETPYFSAVCSRAWIIRMRGLFIEKLKKPGVDEFWPSCKSLVLFRLWTLTFPASDFRHVVLTPCSLLMAEYLIRSSVKSTRDLSVGAFICGLLLSIMKSARRYCPEALCFVYAALTSSLPVKLSTSRATAVLGCGSFMLELVCSEPWLRLQDDCSQLNQIENLEFTDVMMLDRNSPFFQSDMYRLSVLSCLLRTLAGFVNIYEDISCFPEIFDPFITVLQGLSLNRLFPLTVRTLITELSTQISDNINKNERLRQPLRMRVKKPVPIKQFNPKFEENFVRGRNYDPIKERAEAKRLQYLIKEEAKGAARELRKDNYFLQAEKAKEKALAEEEREEKYGKAMAFLQEQEAAFKSGQLGKGHKRRKR